MKMLLLKKQNSGFLILEALIALSVITTAALSVAISLKQYAKWTNSLTQTRQELRQILNTIEKDKSKMEYRFNTVIGTTIYIREINFQNTTFQWLTYEEK